MTERVISDTQQFPLNLYLINNAEDFFYIVSIA